MSDTAPRDLALLDRLLEGANPVALDDLPEPQSAAGDALYSRLAALVEPQPCGAAGLRRPFSRLPHRRLGVAVAAAAAITVAAALLPTRLADRGRVDVIERALAAVSTGPVLHAVLEVPTSEITQAPGPVRISIVDIASGRERPMMTRYELWYDAERQLLRQTSGSEMAVVWESLQTRDRTYDNRGSRAHSGPPTVDPALAAFFTGYRQALEDGTARVSGSGVIDGRPVQWLRFPPRDGRGLPQEIAVDTDSYEPVRLRPICAQCSSVPTYRVIRLEGVSEAAADFRRPVRTERPRIAAFSRNQRTIALAEAGSALGRPALWAGAVVKGANFVAVRLIIPTAHSSFPVTVKNMIGRGRGLTLLYGTSSTTLGKGGVNANPKKPFVFISQAADYRFPFGGFNFNNADAGRPLTIASTPVPPEGELALMSIQAGFWTVQLRKNGLYVEIDGPSRELALAAARALRPLKPGDG
jgi:hypothetical protein